MHQQTACIYLSGHLQPSSRSCNRPSPSTNLNCLVGRIIEAYTKRKSVTLIQQRLLCQARYDKGCHALNILSMGSLLIQQEASTLTGTEQGANALNTHILEIFINVSTYILREQQRSKAIGRTFSHRRRTSVKKL